MSFPRYEISIGETGKDTRVVQDGRDILNTLTGLDLRTRIDDVTAISLHGLATAEVRTELGFLTSAEMVRRAWSAIA